jgi:hypothetical protein
MVAEAARYGLMRDLPLARCLAPVEPDTNGRVPNFDRITKPTINPERSTANHADAREIEAFSILRISTATREPF